MYLDRYRVHTLLLRTHYTGGGLVILLPLYIVSLSVYVLFLLYLYSTFICPYFPGKKKVWLVGSWGVNYATYRPAFALSFRMRWSSFLPAWQLCGGERTDDHRTEAD